MSPIERELQFFEEIKAKYEPIVGLHITLDLDAYKAGKEVLYKFPMDSEEYQQLNISFTVQEKERVTIGIYKNKGFIFYHGHLLHLRFDLEKNEIKEFCDLTPNPYKLNRTMKQQIELLAYELTYPKPRKPAC